MPKESRRSGSRGSNRQRSCEDPDDVKKSSLRETPKIVGSNSVNRFAPFQRDVPRRDSRSGEEETFTTLVRSNVKSGGIIENGMKYIMFPLHLLRFCIFGTTTLSVDHGKDPKGIELIQDRKEEKSDGKIREKDEKSDFKEKDDKTEEKVEKRSNYDSRKCLKDKTKSCKAKNHSHERRPSRDRGNSSDNDNRISERNGRKERSRSNESRKSRADDDSDSSSSDKWSTAESSMDVSIEYESTYESISTSCRLEEPMDISIEESLDENSPSSSRLVSHRSKTNRMDPSSCSSWSSEIEESSSSTSSIDEEISRVFHRKCTSSSSDDDHYSSSTNRRDKRRDESDRKSDRKSRDDVNHRESNSESKERSEKGGSKSSIRRKEESIRDKTVERTTSGVTSCNRHNSSPRRVSRTPVKSKDTRKRYKEKGVQTDSAFSDDDVEMIPLEKRPSNRTSRRKPSSVSYQVEGMDQDILYIADNEDSNDGCGRYSRYRVTPVSESSSSTDLGFEDQKSQDRNYETYVTKKERRKSPLRDDTTVKDLSKRVTLSRAPPGFPQIPQNPPISLKSCIDRGSPIFPFTTQTNLIIPQYGQNYPPAPTPMRHLYHEYPEFMPFPEEIGSLQIFKTIPSNDYLC